MTKSEFIALFAPQATAMAASQEFRALLDTAREECPQLGKEISDATMLVRSEGFLQGWNACLKFLKTAHLLPKLKTGATPTSQYPDPADHPLNPRK
jgi:hypothetical protein